MTSRTHSSLAQWFVGAGWVILCVAGGYWAMRYDFTPGWIGPARTAWPIDTALERRPGAATAVAFLHPRCVCTRATVKQLVRTLLAHPDAALIVAAFIPPSSEGIRDLTAWESNDYVKTIHGAIPSAQIVFDAGGAEALRFGAYTSGTILTYDAQGREIFRGGITDRRGGENDNPGLRALAASLTSKAARAPLVATPVFGCPLVIVRTQKPEGKRAW